MKYSFDELTDRHGTGSLKWDVKENELPMWVADMDFKTAPEISEAIQKKAAQCIYGYSDITDEWYDAYINWWKNRHHLDMKREELIFASGVVPILSSAVRKLTTPAEKVLIQTPVYNIFFNSIINNGRYVLENKLKYENGNYTIDWADLEKKLADPQTTLMILCNPHNPAGNLWDKETLAKIGELCFNNGVTVISDEIHCDIIDPGYEYVPFASVSDICRNISITCIAPTKTFNLAGLQSAAAYVPNKFLRHKIWRGLNTDEVGEPNFFSVTAAVAAFTKGSEWLDELREYIFINKKTVTEYISKNIPEIKVVQSKATYLMWLDCSSLTDNSEEFAKFIRSYSGLYVSAGAIFGGNGNKFLRLNTACPIARIMDGLDRLKKSVDAYKTR